MKNGVVIPCYNEENRLPVEAFKRFVTRRPDYTLCFVNDGSKDATLAKLETIKASAPQNVRIIDLSRNSGKAQAVSLGAMELFNHTSVNNIGFLDADLATGFDDYQRLVQTLEHSKIVIGSRRMQNDTNINRQWLRKFFSAIINFLISLIIRMPISDTQCGAKVFHRDMIPIIFGRSFISKWLFDVEIFIRLKQSMGKKQLLQIFTEHPLKQWNDVEGSKLNLKDSILIPFSLLSIWFRYMVADGASVELEGAFKPTLSPQSSLGFN